MNGLIFCALAFVSVLYFTLADWRRGLCLTIAWGYMFGILKSNYVHSWGHFIFDGAVVGLYAGALLNPPPAIDRLLEGSTRKWVVALIAWPCFLVLIPFQHYLIQAVGLRGNVFFIPMALFGAWLGDSGRRQITITLCLMNLVALTFAGLEYSMGVEAFYPRNETTDIIYKSQDIAGGHFRIPACFANAHSYGGTMAMTVPWILGGMFQRIRNPLEFYLQAAGLVAAGLGTFLCGARSPVAILGILLGIGLMTRRISLPGIVFLVVAASVVYVMVSGEERMQRFALLYDTEAVVGRLSMSANLGFFDLLEQYPFGNGLGGGGTSIPFWLQGLILNPVGLENEYSRILLEQGVVGLLLFMGFVVWFYSRTLDQADPNYATRRLLWYSCAITLATSFIGIGLMTSVPATSMVFLGIGYAASGAERRPRQRPPAPSGQKRSVARPLPAPYVPSTAQTA
jgi:hypothetical protein